MRVVKEMDDQNQQSNEQTEPKEQEELIKPAKNICVLVLSRSSC